METCEGGELVIEHDILEVLLVEQAVGEPDLDEGHLCSGSRIQSSQ